MSSQSQGRVVIRDGAAPTGSQMAAQVDAAFVVAYDMQYVEPSLVEYLPSQSERVDVVFPVVRDYYEPLCAAYRRTCLKPVERLIEGGVLKVSELYPLIEVRDAGHKQIQQHDPKLRSFLNLNAPVEIKSPAQPRRQSCEQHP